MLKQTTFTKDQQAELAQLVDVIALSKKSCERPMLANLVYATKKNFIGRPIAGYTPGVTDFALLTRDSAIALCQVQNELLEKYNYGLLIYDTYRPKSAVLDFMQWSKQPVSDDADGHCELERKQKHYPHIEKNRLFALGYLSETSQHCFGHTVDLVLIDKEGAELNLGARFDFMDEISHLSATAKEIGEEAMRNRHILTSTMEKYGFASYVYEFWHFSYCEKAIADPMDITITADLKNLS